MTPHERGISTKTTPSGPVSTGLPGSPPATAHPPASRPVRRGPLLALGVVAAASWVALAIWSSSGSAYLLDHDGLASADLSAGAALMAGWLLMTVAMMLPASAPLVSWFGRATAADGSRGRLTCVLVAGYLAVWMAFGAVVHAGDWALHRLTGGLTRDATWTWVVGPAVLLVAGGYQFTRTKRRCLTRCCARSPAAAWDTGPDGRPAGRAFQLGMREGAWSLGCCWALMLVMVAAGMASLAHMLAVAAVMAVEKTIPDGTRLTAPLGVALLVAGCIGLAIGYPSA